MTFTQNRQTRSGKTGPLHIRALCPSCKQQADFYFIGTQQWPERVAKLLGKSTITTLWRCSHCRTTLSFDSEEEDSG